MNKLTTTLAGLAVLAAASAIPASAQTFNANGPFSFTFSPTVLGITNIAASYNAVSGPTILGTLSLAGGTSTNGTLFTGNTLTFTGTSQTFSDTETGVTAFVNSFGNGTYLISGATPSGTFTLLPGTATAPAVPEASTVISFGALLALGGLAVLRRKSVAKSAA